MQNLSESLNKIIEKTDKLVVVYSSLPHLGQFSLIKKWDFLKVFADFSKLGITFAFPTFTFSFCKNKVFDPIKSASEVGILGDWVLDLKEARRSTHPIYSFSVLGPLAQSLLECKNSTTFGKDSVFAKFEILNARIIMLGCGWEYCTQFHFYEELYKVPYRYYKTFNGQIVLGEKEQQISTKMFVRNLEINAENDFSSIQEHLQKEEQIKSERLFDGRIQSALCKDISKVCCNILKKNQWGLVANPVLSEINSLNYFEKKTKKALKIAILGHANLELFKRVLEKILENYIKDQSIEVFIPPFGQIENLVLNHKSELYSFKPDFTFWVNKIEDFIGVPNINFIDKSIVESALDNYLSIISKFTDISNSVVFVNSFVNTDFSLRGLADSNNKYGIKDYVKRMNEKLITSLNKISQLHIYQLDNIISKFNSVLIDSRLWYLGRFPFSEKFTEILAFQYLKLILSLTGKTCRLIVVDLDNTLWGGILGEDGIKNLKIKGDYPGNAFYYFQKALKILSQAGIALAICSKNNIEEVKEAFQILNTLELKWDDFVSHKINWEPKWKNILSICQEVNLSPDHVLFIDDNPTEREQVKQFLPNVKVLDLPADPCYYFDVLLQSPWVERVFYTKEDRKRIESYKKRKLITEQKAKFTNVENYYKSLQTEIFINNLNSNNIDRTVQLINKTNQFNVTTKRYSLKELENLFNSNYEVFVVGVKDIFHPYENMGVLIVQWLENKTCSIDTYLLSCRVLGRGIEAIPLQWLINYCKQKNIKTLIGEIIETSRNIPVRNIFKITGFKKNNRGKWIYSINEDTKNKLCDYVKIIDKNIKSKLLVS